MIIKDKLLHTYNNHTEGFFDDYAYNYQKFD